MRRAGKPRAPVPGRQELLEGLNEEQARAVQATEGPVLVLAGAGSGKTRVITRRAAYLVSGGVAARNILAVTFTNKAAREMRERVGALVGPDPARDLTVRTFHSFCVRLLREHAERAGLSPRFTICDESDQLGAVKGALRELRIAEASVHPNAALSRISLLKNRLVTPAQALAEATDDWEELVARTYRAYEGHLKRSRSVDFDDLLVVAVNLVAGQDDVRAMLQDRYRYLMVDEYQDTNGPQYELLRHLAGPRRNLCVVGDDDQSIYGWRGADVKKILNFQKDFPGAEVVRLETNYRSTQEILEAANAVIRNNASRHEKTLRSAAGKGEPVRHFTLEDEEHEAAFVTDEILMEVKRGRAKFGDFAILFRTAVQPRPFEGRLRASRIPYELVGGMSFFDRKEVRDVMAFLRLAQNPDDEQAFLRIVNVPPRGVGKGSLEKAVDAATREGCSATAVFDRADATLPPEAVEGVRGLRRTLADFAAKIPRTGLPQAMRELLLAVRYPAELERNYPDAIVRQARWAAVEEVVNLAENHQRRTPGATLQGFLEEVTLQEEDSKEEDPETPARDRVTLMTLHASKGLEFPRVYLVGCEESLLPHQRSVQEGTVEEERRLMYVGVTRARRLLTLTRVKTRAKFGQRHPCLPSRFLFEIKGEKPPFALPGPEIKERASERKPSKGGPPPKSVPGRSRSRVR
jgi:ATP-dependent DNA helicase Rep/DNA helicase-2/ATP-dependent DNA helicase PcrA